MNVELNPIALPLEWLTVTGGNKKHSSVVEQWYWISCGTGSIPVVSIWQIAIARSCIFPLKVPVFLVGRFMPFKSAHWIFLNRGSLWKKNVVRIVENMMTSHGFASMVIANIAQTLDVWMIIVNTGRVLKMSKISALYVSVDYKDADYFWINRKTYCASDITTKTLA